MNEVIPDLDRRYVASSQCSYTAGGTIRPCATHKDDTVILCGHNSVDTGAPKFITTPARKMYRAFLVVTFQKICRVVCVCACVMCVCKCVCVCEYMYNDNKN